MYNNLSIDEIKLFKRLVINKYQAANLKHLWTGIFAPLREFVGKDDFVSISREMHLKNGTFFPVPIALQITNDTVDYKKGETVILISEEEVPLATLLVEDVYKINNDNFICIGGKVLQLLSSEKNSDSLVLTPDETTAFFKKEGFESVVGLCINGIFKKVHFEVSQKILKSTSKHLFLLQILKEHQGFDDTTLIKCFRESIKRYGSGEITPALTCLGINNGNSIREMLLYARICKNYGCTHIAFSNIADIEKETIKRYCNEMEIKPLFYNSFQPAISEDNLIDYLKRGVGIPHDFLFSDVLDILKKRYPLRSDCGFAVFLTGLPCSGKTTIANALAKRLEGIETSRKISVLDGDVIRKYFSKGLGFSKKDRMENILRIGYIASEIVKHGGIAICAAIAPYREHRDKARKIIHNYGGFIEIFLDIPLDECERRDCKLLYSLARAGIIKNLTGINDPYEPPESPEITLNTNLLTVEQSVDHIIDFLVKQEYIKV